MSMDGREFRSRLRHIIIPTPVNAAALAPLIDALKEKGEK
jgi:hypothetical protein